MQDEDSHESLRQLLKHNLGRATVAAELLCLCGMAPFLYIEAGTFLEYGFYGWQSVWNFMDVVAYVNQVNKLVCQRFCCVELRIYGKTYHAKILSNMVGFLRCCGCF